MSDDKRAEQAAVTANPWQPMTKKLDLAVLGKLLEELGELVAIVARCQIQGIDEAEPATGKVNRVELQKEIADVLAGLTMARIHFGLDEPGMLERTIAKMEHLKAWHGLIVERAELSDDDVYAAVRLLETYTHPFVTGLQTRLGALRQGDGVHFETVRSLGDVEQGHAAGRANGSVPRGTSDASDDAVRLACARYIERNYSDDVMAREHAEALKTLHWGPLDVAANTTDRR